MGYLHFDTLNVSDSSMALIDTCPRKFEFRKMYVSDRRENTMALSVGSAMHTGTQHYVVHGSQTQAQFEMLMQFNFEFQKTESVQNSWQACVHTLDVTMAFWDNEMSEWEIALIKDADGNEIPAVEVPFSFIYEMENFYPDGSSLKVKYVGYIDLILYNRLEDRYAVVDIKSTTKDTDKTVEFMFANQCVPYGLVLEVLLGQDYREGFEVIYWVEYIHPMVAYNRLYPFMKMEQDVQDWMIGFMMKMEQIKEWYAMEWFPRKSNGCLSWNRPCHFFDICNMRNVNELKAFILMENDKFEPRGYRKKPWIEIDLGVAS